jgi:hypothetical protein
MTEKELGNWEIGKMGNWEISFGSNSFLENSEEH